MIIRGACQHDAPHLATLIYASGPVLIESVFGFNQQHNAQDFLLSAASHEFGQYGFANHFIAVENEQVLGSVCAWHTELSASFGQATLHSVVQYFGLEHSLEVVARSQVIKHFISPPLNHEWCIGHFAVFPQYRRQGVATRLLQFMTELAENSGKTTLSLHVAAENHSAIQFYQQQGFSLHSTSELTNEMQNLGFVVHKHMQKKLV
jgi:ribosomal protein S18 acetylase RimI-like enzyme